MIIAIEKSFYFSVIKNGGEFSYYRRYSADDWEVRMGESWESVYLELVDLEKDFQKFVKEKGIVVDE